MSEFDLHPDRLGTTDEFGRRVFPQPADVRGIYRSRRTLVESVLILIFLGLPWFKIRGRQALLLDVTNRKFEIFGLSLRAHNAPLLVLVFAALFFALFFATSLWGRIWCGWACPQTVFIDGVFRRIERFIEGPALERRRLDRAPMTFKKFRLRFLKWTIYFITSGILAHSFLAYFVGTDQVEQMIRLNPNENWSSFVFMVALTSLLAFNFGWFREQFCVIVCPYGRFQSVLMDSNSKIIAYDVNRGEPRSTPQAKVHSKVHGGSLGDCVNCYRCVQVCPVGIDIRRGTQMECIACTGCADACDEVMVKLKKPTGLIRYDSLAGLQKQKKSGVSPRTLIYAAAMMGSLTTLFWLLWVLKPIDVNFLKASEAPYQIVPGVAGDSVINHFNVEVSNQSEENHEIDFVTENEDVELISAPRPFKSVKETIARNGLFVRIPRASFKNGQALINLRVIDIDVQSGEHKEYRKELHLAGPFS